VGLLAPYFLLGALAVGLPLYLHLLRHTTSQPQPFSSLMLFEKREQTATRRRRLRYYLLLALRLAVLLLLALAFAEPYVNEVHGGAAPRKVLLVVIDDSFSMRAGTRLADAKRAAWDLLSAKDPRQQAQVISLGAQAHVLTEATADLRVLRGPLEAIQPSDSRGSFGVLAAAVRAIAEDDREPIEVHLFSDLQKSGMPPAFTEMALPAAVSLVLHPISSASVPNWTVETVAAPKRVWDPHTTHVQAVVAGYGTPAATRTVSFLVNDKLIATRSVDVPPSGRAVAEIDSLELPYGLSRLTVRIDSADVLPADDEYVLAIERADRKRALFVSQSADTRSPLYFGEALAAAAQRAITLDKVTIDATAKVEPTEYAFVVLSDVASLPAAFASRLQDYVRRGGSVFIALGTVAAQKPDTPLTGSKILSLHHYSTSPERFAAVGETDVSYLAAGPPAEWEGVRFFYAAQVEERGARVAMRLQDGTPLLLERPLGEGRVLVFASGLDNLTNDLPLKPVFVAFVERLARDLSGGDAHSGPHQVDDLVNLRSAREQAVGVEVQGPDGKRALSLAESVSASTFQLLRTGFYEVHLANGREDLIAVNADRRESDLTPLPEETLSLWRGSGQGAAPATAAIAPAAQSPAVPRGLWWYAMLAVLAAVLLESAAATRYLTFSRDEP
jgi:hypothetical protein